MSAQYSVADVAKHKDEQEGMYIIVDTGVYDITSMFPLPPSLSLCSYLPVLPVRPFVFGAAAADTIMASPVVDFRSSSDPA